MITFTCQVCGQLLFFDNTVCLRCDTDLVLDPDSWTLIPRAQDEVLCVTPGCNWRPEPNGPRCRSCALTRTAPPTDDPEVEDAWMRAEAAKRRLVFQLHRMGLSTDGVVFDLLSSKDQPVITGHDDGVITLDLAEADQVVRARLRDQMDEPYRTLLGHFRHEIGHWLWQEHVDDTPAISRFRELFGDEREDYAAALEAHYGSDPAADWQESHVSVYATAHPWEDFAETVAHLLHITDVLETAAAVGLTVHGPNPALEAEPEAVDVEHDTFRDVLDQWLPLTYALNAVNRSMGAQDLYPFVLAPPVMRKLQWVHRLLT